MSAPSYLLLVLLTVVSSVKVAKSTNATLLFPDISPTDTLNHRKLLEERQALEDKFVSLLIATSNITDANVLISKLNGDIFSLQEKRGQMTTNQAHCEPQLTTIKLPDDPEAMSGTSLFFPKCVRILRCGGCCGLSDLMECAPTKVTQTEVKRAVIRVKRSPGDSFASKVRPQVVQIDVHEECGCQCRVKEDHCVKEKHTYRGDLCRCQCINNEDELECLTQTQNKVWDTNRCDCRCRSTKRCSTGRRFSHTTCRLS